MSKYVPLFEEHDNPIGWWVGLADCHGIESFIKEPDMSESDDLDRLADLGLADTGLGDAKRKGWSQQVGMLKMRAAANSQRHAIVYRVKLTKQDADKVEDLLANGKYVDSLEYVKEVAIEVQLAKAGGLNIQKSWNLIPNPDLDPYR